MEILSNNFPNSQLEIDDGYEKNYGDFTFDKNKFPDAALMISKLHSWVSIFFSFFEASIVQTNYDFIDVKK